jgi:hypothetical protein
VHSPAWRRPAAALAAMPKPKPLGLSQRLIGVMGIGGGPAGCSRAEAPMFSTPPAAAGTVVDRCSGSSRRAGLTALAPCCDGGPALGPAASPRCCTCCQQLAAASLAPGAHLWAQGRMRMPARHPALHLRAEPNHSPTLVGACRFPYACTPAAPGLLIGRQLDNPACLPGLICLLAGSNDWLG